MPTDNQSLLNKIADLEKKIQDLEDTLTRHNHTGRDGSSRLNYTQDIDSLEEYRVGYAASFSGTTITGPASVAIVQAGRDNNLIKGYRNSQVLLQHLDSTDDSTRLSFLLGARYPSYSGVLGNVTSGGSTLTQSEYSWDTDALVGSRIFITDSGGNFETRTITSNTATVATISGTWGTTVTNGVWGVVTYVYLGAAQYPWQRAYVAEDTAGGVRFGDGETNGGDNGLLYMDATGDLYWRNKAGTPTKLN